MTGKDKKKKKQKILYLILAVLCFYGICVAGILICYSMLHPGDGKYLLITNPLQIIFYYQGHLMEFGFTCGFYVMLLVSLQVFVLDHKKSYASEVMEITPDIHTPVPAGQGQHGTARWLKKEEFDKTFEHYTLKSGDLKKYGKQRITSGGLVLGKENGKNGGEKIYHETRDRHSVTVGATRSGKTRTSVLETIADLILARENIFAVDMKREVKDYTEDRAKKEGYRCISINYMNPYSSDQYNYLQPIIDAVNYNDLDLAINETWAFVSQMVGEPPENGEKLWNNGEAATMAASVMAVVYDNRDRPEYQNVTNVFYFIVEMCQEYRGGLPLQFYIDSLPEEHPSRILLAATKLAAYKTRSSFYVSAVMTLKLFTLPSVYNMTSASNFRIEELCESDQPTIIYLSLPPRDKTFFPLASLTMRQIYDEIDKAADRQGGRVKRRWNFIADEVGNFTKIPTLPNMLSFGTGKGIRLNLYVQSFAQFDDVYGKEQAQIIRDNCDLLVYLRSPNPETLSEISKKLGVYTVSSYSLSTNQQERMHSSMSRGESISLQKRELLTPDEVERIKRPYTLVCSDTYPAITYAPDLSKWQFNKFFGLGDEEFNLNLRIRKEQELKQKERPKDTKIQLWGVWNTWKRHIDRLIEEEQRRKRMEESKNEKQA